MDREKNQPKNLPILLTTEEVKRIRSEAKLSYSPPRPLEASTINPLSVAQTLAVQYPSGELVPQEPLSIQELGNSSYGGLHSSISQNASLALRHVNTSLPLNAPENGEIRRLQIRSAALRFLGEYARTTEQQNFSYQINQLKPKDVAVTYGQQAIDSLQDIVEKETASGHAEEYIFMVETEQSGLLGRIGWKGPNSKVVLSCTSGEILPVLQAIVGQLKSIPD